MSSELLEVDSDESGSVVMLTAYSSGRAEIEVIHGNGCYRLASNKKGRDNAEKIIAALQSWVKQSKEDEDDDA